MAGRGDDLWKPFNVNKLSNTFQLHAAMCDTFNAILQAMEYKWKRKKLWGYIRRFMRLICWIHTRFEGLNCLYRPSERQQTNNMSQWTSFYHAFLSDPVSGNDLLRRWFGEISKSSSGIGSMRSASGGNCSAWRYGSGQLSHSSKIPLLPSSMWLRQVQRVRNCLLGSFK